MSHPPPTADAAAAVPRGDDAGAETGIAERIRGRQAEHIDASLLGAAANIPAVILAAIVLRGTVPAGALLLWIAAIAATVAALYGSVHGPLPWRTGHMPADRAHRARLLTHALFAGAIGAIWGSAALGLGPALGPRQMMFLTLILLGCNAACVSALGSYLPAFFAYLTASLLPLCYASLRRPEIEAGGLAPLVLVFIIALTVQALSYNRQILATFRLRAENEVLADHLGQANAAAAIEMRKKWDMLAHLSHELRTPMTAVIGFSELIRAQMFGAVEERYRGYAEHIHVSGRHALELIDAILEVSRAESGRLALHEEEIAPVGLIEECLHMVEPSAADRRLTLERAIDPALPRLQVDPAKLRQAVLNLLTNAIKYTPEGGRVTLSVGRVAGGLEIAVADTGIGIAAADLERCLEPFVRLGNPLTAGVEGMGLGLPLAKRLIEAQGGRLHLASAPGRGTRVTLRLPAECCRPA